MQDKIISVMVSHSFILLSDKTLCHKNLKVLWLEIAFYLHYALTKASASKKLIKPL